MEVKQSNEWKEMKVRGCLDPSDCVLLCRRFSDCNGCSEVVAVISGRTAQSGTKIMDKISELFCS